MSSSSKKKRTHKGGKDTIVPWDSVRVDKLESDYTFRQLQRAWKEHSSEFVRSKVQLFSAIRGAHNKTANSSKIAGTHKTTKIAPAKIKHRRDSQTTHVSPQASTMKPLPRRRRSSRSVSPASQRDPDLHQQIHSRRKSSTSPSRQSTSPSRRSARRPSLHSFAWSESAVPIVHPRHMQEKWEMESTCLDLLMYSDETIQNYLHDEPDDHVVLVGPSDTQHPYGSSGVCFTRSRLRKLLHDPDATFYPCKDSEITRWMPYPEMQLIKLPLTDYLVYVPAADVENACRNANAHIFQAQLSTLELSRTASDQFVRTGIAVSSNHCQEGTQKHVHRLHPVEFA